MQRQSPSMDLRASCMVIKVAASQAQKACKSLFSPKCADQLITIGLPSSKSKDEHEATVGIEPYVSPPQ